MSTSASGLFSLQKCLEFIGGAGSAQEKSLQFITSLLDEKVGHFSGFDTLRHDLETHGMGRSISYEFRSTPLA